MECEEHVGSTVSSVLEQSNLTILFWMFANSVGVCGVGVVLGTAVRSAWRVWLLKHWREGGGGLPRFPLAGGRLREDMTAQNASKKRISGNVDFLSRIDRTADTKVGGGSAEPHGGYAHRISVRTGHWLGRETSNGFFYR